MSVLSASDARARLPAILDQVQAGDEVTITRHGVPVAVVVRPDSLRLRPGSEAVAVAEWLHQALQGADKLAQEGRGISPERAEELVAEVRRGRSDR